MRNAIYFVVSCVMATTYQPVLADMIQPFDYFSVYSRGSIGRADNRFQATFHGPTGAAGSAYLRSSHIARHGQLSGYKENAKQVDQAPILKLHAVGVTRDSGEIDSTSPQARVATSRLVSNVLNDYVLNVGGDFSAQYSSTFGGHLDVGGHIGMNGVTVLGDLYSGGSIGDYGWGGAMIHGSANAGGTVAFSDRVKVDAVNSSFPYHTPVDHDAVSAYFLNTSALIESMFATNTLTDERGHLIFGAVSGVNVVEVDQKTLQNAWGFTIEGPKDAIVLINVNDSLVYLDNTTWVYKGGVEKESVLLNMPAATELTLSQTNRVNILAPLADTQFMHGRVDGLLVVGDLHGGGHVMGGKFNAGAIPEPTTVVLFALGGLSLILRRHAV